MAVRWPRRLLSLRRAGSVGDARAFFTGWQAHGRPFGFEDEMEYASGAWRWLNGTPSIPSLFAAIEGPRIVRRAGIERIRDKSMRQTERIVRLPQDRGYRIMA